MDRDGGAVEDVPRPQAQLLRGHRAGVDADGLGQDGRVRKQGGPAVQLHCGEREFAGRRGNRLVGDGGVRAMTSRKAWYLGRGVAGLVESGVVVVRGHGRLGRCASCWRRW